MKKKELISLIKETIKYNAEALKNNTSLRRSHQRLISKGEEVPNDTFLKYIWGQFEYSRYASNYEPKLMLTLLHIAYNRVRKKKREHISDPERLIYYVSTYKEFLERISVYEAETEDAHV